MNARIPINDIMLLGYIWLTGASYSTALAMTSHSSGTITEYYGHFRGLVADALDDEDWTVGGQNVIVEVDESKFGKRKYNRGHHVDGAWVIGGIERTAERRFFVSVVDRRDKLTIIDVLSKHVLSGSIVHTDCWRGYAGIEEPLGIEHRTVNHSIGFVDSESGVHTNTIEGKWAGLKRRITLRGRVKDRLPDYLFEQIWRARHRNTLWESFISALCALSYE
jgi:transposase-like protein